jgi:hypothetical protein
VEEFLSTNEKITSEDLSSLEKEITNAINAKNEEMQNYSTMTSGEISDRKPDVLQVIII